MSSDIIDLRDLAKELADLNVQAEDTETPMSEDDVERREVLLELEKELGESLDDAGDNEPYFIPDSAFEDYACELAEDCCDMKSANKWPFSCIDWTQAAEELQQDYTSYTFDGETYWRRS